MANIYKKETNDILEEFLRRLTKAPSIPDEFLEKLKIMKENGGLANTEQIEQAIALLLGGRDE